MQSSLALDRADRLLGHRRAEAALYTTLEPCLMCLGAAFTMRLGSVIYALESPSDGGCETFTSWDENRKDQSMPGYALPRITLGVARAEAAKLFGLYAAAAPQGWARSWAEELARLSER